MPTATHGGWSSAIAGEQGTGLWPWVAMAYNSQKETVFCHRLPMIPVVSPACRPDWSMIDVDGHACEVYEPPQPSSGRAVIYLHGEHEGTLLASSGLRNCIEAAGMPAIAPRAGRSWWLDTIVPVFDARITPERFVVQNVRAEIERRFGVVPPGVAILGTGMGGQGALRIAYRHPSLFPVVAAIAPAIDFHLTMHDSFLNDGDPNAACDLFVELREIFLDAERARQDTAILHVHPLNWPRNQWFASDPADPQWHDGAVRLQSKLVALGIPLSALGIPHTALGIPHTALVKSANGGNVAAYEDCVAQEAMHFILEALDRESRRVL